jgi:hypothetical protein
MRRVENSQRGARDPAVDELRRRMPGGIMIPRSPGSGASLPTLDEKRTDGIQRLCCRAGRHGLCALRGHPTDRREPLQLYAVGLGPRGFARHQPCSVFATSAILRPWWGAPTSVSMKALAAMTIKRGKGLAHGAGKSGSVSRSRPRWRSVRPAPQRKSSAHRRRPKIHPTASGPFRPSASA